MERKQEDLYLVSSDAGGTMTDLFVTDLNGDFVVGKAATTPANESLGFRESLEDAFTYWGMDLVNNAKEIMPKVLACVYTGTSMLNALIIRQGAKVGMIVNKGFEQTFMTTRGRETTLGYGPAEVFHTVYRKRKESYVPYNQIRGVTGKIDIRGTEIIPLYEHEVVKGVGELLDMDVECIAICLLASFANPAHEKRVAEIAKQLVKERGKDIPVITSHEVSPYIKEVSRMNTLVVQAYAGERARKQLFGIEADLKKDGFKYPLQMVLSYGAVTDIRWPRVVEATVSGPVGGILGAKYLGEQIGESNWVVSDVGGTSFDTGVIHNGHIALNREPEFQRMYLTLPMLDVRSIGAGAGTYIRLDEYTNRIKLGPDSASGTPGPVAYDKGNLTPTICDCGLLMGRLNPDYFLGGKVKLNMDLAYKVFKEKIADKLNMDVYKAAEIMVDLLDARMAQHLVSTIAGHDPKDFVLAGFGGAAGLHMAAYSGEVPWKGVCTMPWAAGFSAFGCAAMDYAHRYANSIDMMIPSNPSESVRRDVAKQISSVLAVHREEALRHFGAEGFAPEKIKCKPFFLMKFFAQIMDIEVQAPTDWVETPEDVSKLIAEFEQVYRATYTQVGLAPGTPYQITQIGLTAVADKVKPRIVTYDLEAPEPPRKAFKRNQKVFYKGQWHDTNIYELDEIRAGNKISGIAILEGPAYTLFIPPEQEVEVDHHKLIWLKKKKV
ncbi:MAG: hydantoinase/oxoprolinase family protein [Sterolibacterium sp.]